MEPWRLDAPEETLRVVRLAIDAVREVDGMCQIVHFQGKRKFLFDLSPNGGLNPIGPAFLDTGFHQLTQPGLSTVSRRYDLPGVFVAQFIQ